MGASDGLRKGSKEKAVREGGSRTRKGKKPEARLVKSRPQPDPRGNPERSVTPRNLCCPKAKELGFLFLH